MLWNNVTQLYSLFLQQ